MVYVLLVLGVVGWFAYGWGFAVINNYSTMAAKIERLERDKKLIDSRVESLRTLLERRDAAIAASQCRVQIQTWIKDPDRIPGFRKDPFNPDAGG